MNVVKKIPIHPGKILRDEFLLPMGITANALASALFVSASRINDVVLERRGVTADTALRLANYFGNEPEFWMNLQVVYDLDVAKNQWNEEVESHIKLQRQIYVLSQRNSARKERRLQDVRLVDLHREAIKAIGDRNRGDKIRGLALKQVEKWEENSLCSPFYIDAWRRILNMPTESMSDAIFKAGDESVALMQNTPFGFLVERVKG